MKILVLNGSPKKESTTMLLSNAFIEGLGKPEDNEIKIVSSYEKNIKYCMGDLSCWFRQDGHCIIQDDDMNELLDDIVASDIIIWSFPLYCHSIPASLKAILGRTIAFFKINMVETASCVYHEKSFDLSEKKNIFIIGGGYPFYPDNFTSVKMQLQTYFSNPLVLCVCETALFGTSVPELELLKENLFSQLTTAGQEYIANSFVSDGVINSIEKPMIPNKLYLSIINSSAINNR